MREAVPCMSPCRAMAWLSGYFSIFPSIPPHRNTFSFPDGLSGGNGGIVEFPAVRVGTVQALGPG